MRVGRGELDHRIAAMLSRLKVRVGGTPAAPSRRGLITTLPHTNPPKAMRPIRVMISPIEQTSPDEHHDDADDDDDAAVPSMPPFAALRCRHVRLLPEVPRHRAGAP